MQIAKALKHATKSLAFSGFGAWPCSIIAATAALSPALIPAKAPDGGSPGTGEGPLAPCFPYTGFARA